MHTKLCLSLGLLTLAAAPLSPTQAQGTAPQTITHPTLTVLHSFSGTDGSMPEDPLTIGADGALYGVTPYGGSTNNAGTVFKVTKGGVFHTLADLTSANGAIPTGPLLLMPDGALVGITYNGGKSGTGSLFLLTPPHRFQTKHEFASVSSQQANVRGAHPSNRLALGPDGAVYGTTERGGSTGQGVAYRWTAAHGLEVLHDFVSANGQQVSPEGLTLGPDGNLYGVTIASGANSDGTVYRLTTDGVYTLLHSFNGKDGLEPVSPPVVGADGALYGTTEGGGKQNTGVAYRITTEGAFTLLHSFNKGSDGINPLGLALGPDGNLYGACLDGGTSYGTLFRLTPAGALTRLYSFGVGHGGYPYCTVTVGADGTLYGATSVGGVSGGGTVFKLRLP